LTSPTCAPWSDCGCNCSDTASRCSFGSHGKSAEYRPCVLVLESTTRVVRDSPACSRIPEASRIPPVGIGSRGVVSLVGRDEEIAEVSSLVDRARHGLSSVLVVRGEAGIGKTGLLASATSSAQAFDVVRLVGVESEMQLGFAGLHQLLSPFLDDIGSLPPPQARALKAAFGISDDVAPDLFLTGLAALTLITAAAAKGRPLLVLVDDAQWLDRESADAIGFLARRLYADRICLLVAIRDADEDLGSFDGLPELPLGPLPDAAAALLLEAASGARLGDVVRGRLLVEARGNPLALTEFVRDLSPDQLAGVAQLPELLAVDRGLERSFLRQLVELPLATRRLLVVAAAEPSCDVSLILRAGRELDIADGALTTAQAAGLIELGPELVFRHPLIRSAIYHGASDVDRYQAHLALALACEEKQDADRRAWHRGAAAQLPDDDVADDLERAAGRASSRGGCAASAMLLARAAELTTDKARRAVRFLGAAASDLASGSFLRAQTHLDLALPDLGDPLLQAQALQLDAVIAFSTSLRHPTLAPRGGGEIISMMLGAARAMEPIDMALAREALIETISMAVFFGGPGAASAAHVARLARSLKPAKTVPTAVDLMYDAIAELMANGYPSAGCLLQEALAAVQDDPGIHSVPRHLSWACWLAAAMSDVNALSKLADDCAKASRDQGHFEVLLIALYRQGMRDLCVGSLHIADEVLTEAIELHSLFHRSSELLEASRLIVSAWQGHENEVRAGAAKLAAPAAKYAIVSRSADYALLVLELGLGRYHAAASLARERWDEDLTLGNLRAADTIEALVRSGNRPGAATPLAYLTQRATVNKSPLDSGLLSRSCALLASDSDAEPQFRESILALEATGIRLHVARTQLVYGEWLRRQKRRRDARAQLEAALDSFKLAGAEGFAERTGVELRATGAQARKRVDGTRNDLTPQERQIARLAGSGASNAQIAERLFISTSTVDYHLRKVYRKLEIQSRRQLEDVVLEG
jgi:DNA-binding CsgD family transcriptional regulator